MTYIDCAIEDCELNFDGKCSCMHIYLDTSPKTAPSLICRDMRKKQ